MRSLRTPILSDGDGGMENPIYRDPNIENVPEAIMVDVNLENNGFLDDEEIMNEERRSHSPPTHDI